MQARHAYTYKYSFKKRECSLELDIFESHIYLIPYKTQKKDKPKLKTFLVRFRRGECRNGLASLTAFLLSVGLCIICWKLNKRCNAGFWERNDITSLSW